MYILGISCFYHDSSAALLKDGVVVVAVGEERFTRKKHDNSFPINAINYCLESQKIQINNIGYIGFYEKPFLKFERVLHQFIETFPKSFKSFLTSLPAWYSEKLRIIKIIRKKLKYKGDILFIEHHLAHAASAFLVSPFEKSAILTIDGVGEWSTTTYGIGERNKIDLIKEIRFPHSLGLLYSTITAYLGFTVNNDEYKIMGLSAYGKKNRENIYYKKLKKVIDIKNDGSYRLNMNYFGYHYSDRMPSRKLCELLGGPVLGKGSKLEQRHKDIAATLQMVVEETIIKILRHIYNITKCENIVLAGGVALNSVANGKILKNTPFKNIWIQPNASDGGSSIGVASYIFHVILGQKRNYQMNNIYLGPEFSTKQIKEFLDENKIKYYEFKSDTELIKTTAKLIFKDKIIGWFQGRMEWGPRALGNRSILANPLNPAMKDILNLKVKHREEFRPFAPVVCREDASRYFECSEPIPEPTKYMLMVYPVKQEWQNKLLAITHVDGSARLQVIERNSNPRYYDLIKEFGKLSGASVLINTSFNTGGAPIVCTFHDAYNCFMDTEIGYLIMNNFLISRHDNIMGKS